METNLRLQPIEENILINNLKNAEKSGDKQKIKSLLHNYIQNFTREASESRSYKPSAIYIRERNTNIKNIGPLTKWEFTVIQLQISEKLKSAANTDLIIRELLQQNPSCIKDIHKAGPFTEYRLRIMQLCEAEKDKNLKTIELIVISLFSKNISNQKNNQPNVINPQEIINIGSFTKIQFLFCSLHLAEKNKEKVRIQNLLQAIITESAKAGKVTPEIFLNKHPNFLESMKKIGPLTKAHILELQEQSEKENVARTLMNMESMINPNRTK